MENQEDLRNLPVDDKQAIKDSLQDFLPAPTLDVLWLLNKADMKHRVVKRDGRPFLTSRDFQPYRANLEIENDIVVSVTFG